MIRYAYPCCGYKTFDRVCDKIFESLAQSSSKITRLPYNNTRLIYRQNFQLLVLLGDLKYYCVVRHRFFAP